MLIVTLFVVLVYAFNFKNNSNYLSSIDNMTTLVTDTCSLFELTDGKKVTVNYGFNSLKVYDCYLLNKEERLELVSIVKKDLKDRNINCDRTVYSLEGELVTHVYAYNLGIKKASTQDADLEYTEDPRWYVRAISGLFQILGN